MASEQLEEYLESILDIEEKDGIAKTSAIAKCMKVAPASVTEALQTLADKGFVHYEPYRGAYLTEQGREMARKVKRRHRLLEVFLNDVLHINGENVHDEACKMEHTLSDETECALCKMLNAPARCPHGSLIEACDRDVESCSACLLENTPPSTLHPGRAADTGHCPPARPESHYRLYPGRQQCRAAPHRSRAHPQNRYPAGPQSPPSRPGRDCRAEDPACHRSCDR